MILQAVQAYLRERHVASLQQMEAGLGVSAEALSGMLDLLERKGRVCQLPRPRRCHGCSLCEGKALQFYRWQGGSSRSSEHVQAPPPA
ncbi:MAG: FeoC-like transcriptional regulator [Cyanobacteria bacterium J06638_7]